MGMKGRSLAVIAGAAIVAGIAVTAAFAAHRATPGITATSVTIGGTFPLTGPASPYKTIPAAESAYFAYVNDRGGVNKRMINFKVLDDSYSPAKTVPLTQQLVEQDNVFAVFGSLGTAPNLSVWSYLNSRKVPQALIATGDSYWGYSAKKYPWTIGYQPDYPGESKIYGKYLSKNMPTAKIGVLYQNDSYGKNYFAGLRVGLGKNKENIVSAQPYDATSTSVTSQVLALKASGANVFVVFALPTQTIGALVTATKVGWTPNATIINNVSANPAFLKIAAASGGERRRSALDELPQPRDHGEREHAGSRTGEVDHREVRAVAWTSTTRTSSMGWAPRGRSSTRCSTPARTRPGPAS